VGFGLAVGLGVVRSLNLPRLDRVSPMKMKTFPESQAQPVAPAVYPRPQLPPRSWVARWFCRSVVWVILASVSGRIVPVLAEEAVGAERTIASDQERQFWAFQRPRRTVAPVVITRAWVRQPIDAFILARLERHGVSPSPPAARAAWLRRVSYDLIGLPPTSAEVEAFLQDSGAGGEERAVDRLLASPRFGERWASLWLPLARYAEDQAHQVGDDTKYFYPNAWRYRAWVIDAFNQDMPYDQFLQRQIAADLIDGTNTVHRAALGFLGLGPKYYNRDRLDVMADEWEDRVDTVTRGMLGLTVACARCHDHKFEPVTMRDYYALAGVFASTRMLNARPDGAPEDEKADAKTMAEGTVHVVAEGERKPVHIFLRGQSERPGPEVERSFPSVLSLPSDRAFLEGSGRRELARMIARAENPLVARVWVNRVWGALFGQPLVASPSNFGHSGTPPTYPELLDDVAARFVEQGWSTKQLMRELVLSATYRQATGDGSLAAPTETTDGLGRRDRGVDQWAALAGAAAH
jgi:Protein of unknown function (DUF1549)/Protein of unknown function (DUF1553)